MRQFLILLCFLASSCEPRPDVKEIDCLARAARLAVPADDAEWTGRHTIESREPHYGKSSGRCYLLIRHRVHGVDNRGEFSNPFKTLIDLENGQTVARCGNVSLSCRIGREYAVDCERCENLIRDSMSK